jgi:hypothetical protein
MNKDEIGIYELVKGIREDFKKVADDPEIEKNPLLILKTVEISLNVVVSSVTHAGIKFSILNAGKKYENEKLTSIKLILEPFVKVEQKKSKFPIEGGIVFVK